MQEEHPRLQDVEAVVGARFFDDPERQRLAYEQPGQLEEGDLDERRHLYVLASNSLLKFCIAEREIAADNARLAGEPFDEKAWAANWRPRPEQIEEAQAQAHPAIGRRLSMLNRFEDYMQFRQDEPNASGVELRPHQQPLGSKMLNFLREHVGQPPWAKDIDPAIQPLIRSARAVMPTGGGKTVWAARTIEEMGIGQVISEQRPEPLRALYVVPTKDLVWQALRGRDGRGSLAQLAPSIGTVTSFYGENKDTSGNVVVTTTDSLIDIVDNGLMADVPPAVVIFDEAQNSLGPQVRSAFERLISESGAIAVGMTATPYYNLSDRHIDELFNYSLYEGRLKTYVEDGVLNSAQLVGVAPTQQLPTEVMTSLDQVGRTALERKLRTQYGLQMTAELARQGLRGLVYCYRGNSGEHAREFAERLWHMGIRAASVSSTAKPSAITEMPWRTQDVLDAYMSGDIQVIAATDMLKQGTDLPVDFVGVLRRFMSMVDLEQAIGRGMRYDPDNPVTVLYQFLSFLGHNEGSGVIAEANIWDLFDKNKVVQGEIIGPHQHSVSRPDSDDSGGPGGLDYSRDHLTGDRGPRSPRKTYGQEDDLLRRLLAELPDDVRALLNNIDHMRVREVMYGPYRLAPPPENYVPFHVLLGPDEKSFSPVTVRNYFKRAGIETWVEAIDPDTGLRDYYFSAEDLETMNEIVKPRATPDLHTIHSMKNGLGETEYMLKRAITDLEIRGRRFRSLSGNMETEHYTDSDREKIVAHLAKLEVAAEDDVSVIDLIGELHIDRPRLLAQLKEKYDIDPVEKRIAPRTRTADFLTAAQVEIARNDPELNIPFVPEGNEWTAVRDIMAQTGQERADVQAAINDAGYHEKIRTFKVTSTRGNNPSINLQHVPTAIVNEIVEKLQTRAFPSDAVSLNDYVKQSGFSRKGVLTLADKNGVTLNQVTRGDKDYYFLTRENRAKLDEAIAKLEPARPGWWSVWDISEKLGISYDTVKVRQPKDIGPDDAREMQVEPDTLNTRLYYKPEAAARLAREAAWSTIMSSDRKLSQLELTSEQLSILAGVSPLEVDAKAKELGGLGGKGDRTYSGTFLKKLIRALSIEPDDPADQPDAETRAEIRRETRAEIRTTAPAAAPPAVFTAPRVPAAKPVAAPAAAPAPIQPTRPPVVVSKKPPMGGQIITGAEDKWQPRAVAEPGNFISKTERLTADEIALRLGISETDVEKAIQEAAPSGGTLPTINDQRDNQTVQAYTGDTLISIREQLVGVPRGFMELQFRQKADRLEGFFRRRGFTVYNGDRYSPQAYLAAYQTFYSAAGRHTNEEDDEPGSEPK